LFSARLLLNGRLKQWSQHRVLCFAPARRRERGAFTLRIVDVHLAPQKDRRPLKDKMPADDANATLAPEAGLGPVCCS